jgi:hypothetical protein
MIGQCEKRKGQKKVKGAGKITIIDRKKLPVWLAGLLELKDLNACKGL